MQLFALAQADLDLDARVFEIDRERDQRVPVLLGLAEQVADLALVHQQLAHAQRVLIKDVALFVGGNMHPAHEKLAILESAVGILEIDLPLADGFHLGARKLDARLVFILHKVVMPCFFVGRDLLCAFFVRHSTTSFAVV